MILNAFGVLRFSDKDHGALVCRVVVGRRRSEMKISMTRKITVPSSEHSQFPMVVWGVLAREV
jgi:hypothetical protein